MTLQDIINEMQEEIDVLDIKIIDEENDDFYIWSCKRNKTAISNYLEKLKKLNEEAVSGDNNCDNCFYGINYNPYCEPCILCENYNKWKAIITQRN